jgi:alpha-D-xyloside xylohydrolase
VQSADTRGLAVFRYADRDAPEGIDLALLDLTDARAREVLWSRLRESYLDIGGTSFWLDACEPELYEPAHALRETTARYRRGEGMAVSSLFPLYFARAVREGLDAQGGDDGMLLARSAWAGSQRFGVAVWSGDIQSTWEALRGQVTAGLNMMVSGIPWWTSDIGGFFDSDIETDYFRELVVRWFQFAVFWPIFRLHGNRNADFYNSGLFSAGDANEVLSFGQAAYEVITGLLAFRERLRPYLHAAINEAASTGVPSVRPLWFAFPDDAEAVSVDDQFLVGDTLLVAPILWPAAQGRNVLFPAGKDWRNVWTGMVHSGGTTSWIEAPLSQIPVFEVVDGALGVDASWFAPGESVRAYDA